MGTGKLLGEHGELRRQNLARDRVSVALRPLFLIFRHGKSHGDAIRYVKAGVLTDILQATDDVSSPTFGLEFFGDLGI